MINIKSFAFAAGGALAILLTAPVNAGAVPLAVPHIETTGNPAIVSAAYRKKWRNDNHRRWQNNNHRHWRGNKHRWEGRRHYRHYSSGYGGNWRHHHHRHFAWGGGYGGYWGGYAPYWGGGYYRPRHRVYYGYARPYCGYGYGYGCYPYGYYGSPGINLIFRF